MTPERDAALEELPRAELRFDATRGMLDDLDAMRLRSRHPDRPPATLRRLLDDARRAHAEADDRLAAAIRRLAELEAGLD